MVSSLSFGLADGVLRLMALCMALSWRCHFTLGSGRARGMSRASARGTALTEFDLAPCQTHARAVNGPVKPLQPKLQFVAHPVGLSNLHLNFRKSTYARRVRQPGEPVVQLYGKNRNNCILLSCSIVLRSAFRCGRAFTFVETKNVPETHAQKKERLMAQHTVGRTDALSPSASHAPSLHTVLLLRLTGGLVALFGAIISFVGTSWDIQWHTLIGRDRTLIPPHEMMLTGITLGGIAALTVIITETIWARRYKSMAQEFTPFAGLFSGPLGAYIIGYAALNSAVAFPLDTYWHTLYGIDVTLWAPFHIMIISGMALMAFGAVYILASAAHLAARLQAKTAERTAYLGRTGAFAAPLSLCDLLVAQGSSPKNSVPLGFASFSLYPVLTALLLGCLLGGAVYALPRKWVATSIVGVTFLFAFIDQLVIPPALTWLMQIEQLTYRAGHANPPPVSLVAVAWPLVFLVSAL